MRPIPIFFMSIHSARTVKMIRMRHHLSTSKEMRIRPSPSTESKSNATSPQIKSAHCSCRCEYTAHPAKGSPRIDGERKKDNPGTATSGMHQNRETAARYIPRSQPMSTGARTGNNSVSMDTTTSDAAILHYVPCEHSSCVLRLNGCHETRNKRKEKRYKAMNIMYQQ